ncbi:hypothetical protein M758_2G045700 [Ceratodon purpureus]|nr:hypothetical protein M758_2G045700 [Ceratodon purpureus]
MHSSEAALTTTLRHPQLHAIMPPPIPTPPELRPLAIPPHQQNPRRARHATHSLNQCLPTDCATATPPNRPTHHRIGPRRNSDARPPQPYPTDQVIPSDDLPHHPPPCPCSACAITQCIHHHGQPPHAVSPSPLSHTELRTTTPEAGVENDTGGFPRKAEPSLASPRIATTRCRRQSERRELRIRRLPRDPPCSFLRLHRPSLVASPRAPLPLVLSRRRRHRRMRLHFSRRASFPPF